MHILVKWHDWDRKVTIARTVAQTLKENGQLGANFFFKKGEADSGNPRRFISTTTK